MTDNNEILDTEEGTTEENAATAAEVEVTEPSQVVIEANNPSTEEMAGITETIKVNYDFSVDVKPVTFNFKKSKDKDTGIETIREAVQLAIPYPSVDGIVAILENGGKELELLQDAIGDVINAQARELLYEDTAMSAATLPVDKLSWKFIANMPKAQRRGGGIPKETWEAFGKDYIAVMPAATGKNTEQVTNMAKILTTKLANVKTNKDVLELVVEQITIYADNSENVADFADCVEFLAKKADDLLNVSPEELLAAL